MTAITFDTLAFTRRLEQGGFTSEQAETLAEAQVEIEQSNLKSLATKSDLHELELRLTLRMGAIMAVGVGALFALLRLFPAV